VPRAAPRSAADDDEEPSSQPSPLERLKALVETGADGAALVRPSCDAARAAAFPSAALSAHASLTTRPRLAPQPSQEAVALDIEAALSAAHDRAAAAAAAAADADAAVKASKDSLLRLNAEFQNFRNRTEREKSARARALRRRARGCRVILTWLAALRLAANRRSAIR
jgi:hypothetical protein